MLQIQILINFLTHPLVITGIVYFAVFSVLKKVKRISNIPIYAEFGFFYVGFLIWVLRLPYQFSDFIPYLFFTFIVIAMSNFHINSKNAKKVAAGSFFSLSLGISVSLILFPIFQKLSQGSMLLSSFVFSPNPVKITSNALFLVPVPDVRKLATRALHLATSSILVRTFDIRQISNGLTCPKGNIKHATDPLYCQCSVQKTYTTKLHGACVQ